MAYNDRLDNCREILGHLISYDVLGGQSNLTILDYIIGFLNDRQIEYYLVPNEDMTKSSLHCRIGPEADGGVILSGHTDVVPVKGQDWHTEPFTLTARDGKLYGRGSCDMKGFLACCLATVDVFKSAILKKPVYFAFSYDEEIGCLAGPALAKAIKKHYNEKPAYAIIGEPSMMKVVTGHKGICVLKTTITGSAGHSSRIRSEVSAIHVAARLIAWMEDKMEALITSGKLDYRFEPPHSTIHAGMIQGGIAPNVIADKCTIYWDTRVIPADNVSDIVAGFEAWCSVYEKELKQRFPGASIVTQEDHPPVVPLGTDRNAAIVQLVTSLVGDDSTQTVAYAAEAGQFAAEGFGTVICGPGDIAQAHRANEFVEESQLSRCLDMLQALAHYLSDEKEGQ